MDSDGSDPTQLTMDAVPKSQLPDWSPDGSKIAYADAPGDVGNIWVIDADGSDPVQLTTDPRTSSDPSGRPTARRSPSSATGAESGSCSS